MSLDTVLEIGRVLRSAENNLKYFKYVEPCPRDKVGNWPICITIPLKEDLNFDWNGMKITPENQRESLFYLKFKTSDSDGLVKYVFGDIFYQQKAIIKKDGSIDHGEGGYYRLENPDHTQKAFRKSSFFRGKDDYYDIVKNNKFPKTVIQRFHEQLERNITYIENILKYAPAVESFLEHKNGHFIIDYLNDKDELFKNTIKQIFDNTSISNKRKLGLPSELNDCNEVEKRLIFNYNNTAIFIHFDFPGTKYWYNHKTDMELLNLKVFSEFVHNTPNGLVLKKTLYNPLCSGDKKNDIQFPLFTEANRYKSKNFQNDDLQDLFYAIDYTSKGKIINGTKIKLIVLPKGEYLTAKDYDDFLEKRDEARIIDKNRESKKLNADPIFDFFSEKEKNITSFDLIFCNKGSISSPYTYLIELSGIEKSKLRLISERIYSISQEIGKKRKTFFKTEKELYPLNITYSFIEILGNPQNDIRTSKVAFKPNSRYQSHILKVLPLIYTESYHHDEALLPAFIQNAEFSIRAGDPKFNFLKYNFEFLLKIQNSKIDRFMEITSSESYEIGFLLGEIAKDLSQEINCLFR